MRSFKENTWPIIYFIKNDITTKLNNLKENEYYNVYSAFNGFAIYKTQKYFNDEQINNMIKYLNSQKIKDIRTNICIHRIKENCEHISFHLDSIRKNNAKIMITKDILFN